MNKYLFLLRLHQIVRAVEHEEGMDALDLRCRALLRLIGEEDAAGSPLRVRDVVKERHLGNRRTIFTSLNKLQAEGWVERRDDAEDGRAKRIHLTQRALRAFARMSRLASGD